MHEIDLSTWRRRRYYELFSSFNHPHLSLCANVEVTAFHQYMRDHQVPFTAALVYVIARAANAIPEFRLRIRCGKVVEHDVVHPSVTVLVDDDLFSFCTIAYSPAFGEFIERARTMIEHVKKHPTLEDGPGQDDLLFMTALPWVSFTSFTHPMQMHPTDSIPRFAWGKYFQEGQCLKMPLSVQGHHALMDGIHFARMYARVEDYLQHPAELVA